MTNAEYYLPLQPEEPSVVVLQLIDESGHRHPPEVVIDSERYGQYDWYVDAKDRSTGYVDWFEKEPEITALGLLPFVCRAIGKWQQQGPYEVDRQLARVVDPLGNDYEI